MEEEYHILMTKEQKGRTDAMCNLSQGIKEDAREEGMKTGIELAKQVIEILK